MTSTTTEQRAFDIITARIFGQYLTMSRVAWQALLDDLKPSDDPMSTYRHVAGIAQRDAD